MAVSGSQTVSPKHGQVVVIDLGTQSTKAVYLQSEPAGLRLLNLTVQNTPALEPDRLQRGMAEHLKKVFRSLNAKTREVILVVEMQDAVLRTLELPRMRRAEMRQALRLNTGKFFHQDVSRFTFDCSAISPHHDVDLEDGSNVAGQIPVLVGGAKAESIAALRAAAKAAGLRTVQIVPRQVALANAALLGMFESSRNDISAILDLGERTVAVSVLRDGRLVLTRVVEIGDELNRSLEEAFTVPYPVAEEIRQKLIRTRLQNLLYPLGQDVCTAIDYFESQLDRRISRGYYSGGTERSDLVFEMLQKQLEFSCQRVEPANFPNLQRTDEPSEPTAKELPQLAVAMGAAAGWWRPELIRLSLLAEELEAQAWRRRDPVRWCTAVSAAVLLLLLALSGYSQFRIWQTARTLGRFEAELKSLRADPQESVRVLKKANEVERLLAALETHATNRFLCAPALSALQQTVVDDVQFVRLTVQERVTNVEATKPRQQGSITVPGKPGYSRAQVTLEIQGKIFGDARTREQCMEAIARHSYFQEHLRDFQPVVLKSCLPQQVDPLNPAKTFTLFTIECVFPERILGYE